MSSTLQKYSFQIGQASVSQMTSICCKIRLTARFPDSAIKFTEMVAELDQYDPFIPRPKISARKFVSSFLQDKLLVEMLFCPLMFYGASQEDDMDLSQFVILFRAIFQEGFFRPDGTIKDFPRPSPGSTIRISEVRLSLLPVLRKFSRKTTRYQGYVPIRMK